MSMINMTCMFNLLNSRLFLLNCKSVSNRDFFVYGICDKFHGLKDVIDMFLGCGNGILNVRVYRCQKAQVLAQKKEFQKSSCRFSSSAANRETLQCYNMILYDRLGGVRIYVDIILANLSILRFQHHRSKYY